jgi:hypothetical protein
MSKKNIKSIVPIKDPNTVSVYELSRKIDSLCKVVQDISQKTSDFFDLDISDDKIETSDYDIIENIDNNKKSNELITILFNEIQKKNKRIDLLEEKVNLLEEKISKFNYLL